MKKKSIEVGKSLDKSVEQKFPRVHESREDLHFENRPDPLQVEVKEHLRPYWAKDTPDSIRKLEQQGYITADETHFKDPKDVVKTFGDLRLMVCLQEDYQSRQVKQQKASKAQMVNLQSQLKRQGIRMTDRKSNLKGYVGGYSFDN